MLQTAPMEETHFGDCQISVTNFLRKSFKAVKFSAKENSILDVSQDPTDALAGTFSKSTITKDVALITLFLTFNKYQHQMDLKISNASSFVLKSCIGLILTPTIAITEGFPNNSDVTLDPRGF